MLLQSRFYMKACFFFVSFLISKLSFDFSVYWNVRNFYFFVCIHSQVVFFFHEQLRIREYVLILHARSSTNSYPLFSGHVVHSNETCYLLSNILVLGVKFQMTKFPQMSKNCYMFSFSASSSCTKSNYLVCFIVKTAKNENKLM